MLTLENLLVGEQGVIARLDMEEEVMRRVAAFGLVPGGRVSLMRRAPLGGPLLLQVGTTRFLLRRALARTIGLESRA